MNTLKIQQELLKALMTEPERVKYFPADDDRQRAVFLTVTGTVGYVLPFDELRVDITLAQSMLDLDLDRVVRPENLLEGTDEYRRGGDARRYHRGKDEVYVSKSLLKNFDDPRLYYDPVRPLVVVTEDRQQTGRYTIVGAVAPVLIKE